MSFDLELKRFFKKFSIELLPEVHISSGMWVDYPVLLKEINCLRATPLPFINSIQIPIW